MVKSMPAALTCTVLYCTVLCHTDLVLQPVVYQLQHLCRQCGAHADLCVPATALSSPH